MRPPDLPRPQALRQSKIEFYRAGITRNSWLVRRQSGDQSTMLPRRQGPRNSRNRAHTRWRKVDHRRNRWLLSVLDGPSHRSPANHLRLRPRSSGYTWPHDRTARNSDCRPKAVTIAAGRNQCRELTTGAAPTGKDWHRSPCSQVDHQGDAPRTLRRVPGEPTFLRHTPPAPNRDYSFR